MSEHTCHSGPLCAYWSGSHWSAADPGMCEHSSCCEIVHEWCQACVDEAYAEMAREKERLDGYDKYAFSAPGGPFCPIDMTRLYYRGEFSAPGYGQSWECRCGHPWTRIGRQFADYVPELSLADVR